MTDRLFEYFRAQANARGLVLASETKLIRELKTSHEAIAAVLSSLESEGRIEVLTPLPYVVLRLRSWPGISTARVHKEQQDSGQQRNVHIEVPVSSSVAAAAAIQSRVVGGAGEGEALLREVVESLDEADPEEFRTLLEPLPPQLIRRALRRTLATPPSQIRKSKAALFRYLLTKLA